MADHHNRTQIRFAPEPDTVAEWSRFLNGYEDLWYGERSEAPARPLMPPPVSYARYRWDIDVGPIIQRKTWAERQRERVRGAISVLRGKARAYTQAEIHAIYRDAQDEF